MSPSLYDEVVAELHRRPRDEWRRVGLRAGVGATFCKKLAYGERENPRWKNLLAVAETLGISHRVVRASRAAS